MMKVFPDYHNDQATNGSSNTYHICNHGNIYKTVSCQESVPKSLNKMLKLKLLMIGPPGSGKTAIANYLSECIDVESGAEIEPTQGARILEFDSSTLSVNNKQMKAEIELWDCSGDHRYESCWPAFRSKAHGVIFVCSSNNAVNATREFDLLYNYFVLQPRLSPKQCVVFYHSSEIQQDVKGLRLSSTFGKISQVSVNIADGGNKLRSDFSNYLISVMNFLDQDNIVTTNI